MTGVTNTGGRYDPGTDSWVATSTTGAPAARGWPTAVWTGSEMIVWGGETTVYCLQHRRSLQSRTDSWTRPATSQRPDPRDQHTAVWTGTEMIVWGGRSGLQ